MFGWKLLKTREKDDETVSGTQEEGESVSFQRETSTAQYALFCTFCGRKLPLSFYTNTHGDSRLFHPLKEHRYFCLWGKTDLFGKKVYGWNICLNYIYDQNLKGKGQKSIFDRRNEISKLNFELTKGIDTVKKIGEDIDQKMNIINDLAAKYNLTGDISNLKDRINSRRQEFDEILNEVGEDMHLARKKLK